MMLPTTGWRPEHTLLCNLIRSRVLPSTLAAVRAQAGRVDWCGLLDTAEAHGVSELLLAPLQAANMSVPDRIVARIERRIVSVTAVNLGRTIQAARLIDHLSAHSIRALTFKGPTLAAAMYGHLGLRSCADIDLLVHPRDVARLRPLLLAEGYRLPPRARRRGGSLVYGLYPAAGRDDTLLPPEPGLAPVDVHVGFATWRQGIRLDIDRLFERAITIEIAGAIVPTLCERDLLMALCIHGMMHGWSVVRHIRDIDAVARQIGNWDTVADDARSARLQRTLHVALLVSHGVLGTELPPRVLERAKEDGRAVAVANGVAKRLFEPPAAPGEWDPRPWSRSFLDGRWDGARFHARDLLYEWFLKWPWDEWLRRRGASNQANRV